LWVGLLYSDEALDAAWDRVKHWSIEEREQLRREVPKLGLQAPVPGGGSMHDLGREVLEIAALGLRRRAELNAAGDNEGGFLDPLREVIATGKAPADRLLERYHGDWGGNVSRIYEEFSF
jgi:glutamate--cysteine ligase